MRERQERESKPAGRADRKPRGQPPEARKKAASRWPFYFADEASSHGPNEIINLIS
jgi:hypothetical protein